MAGARGSAGEAEAIEMVGIVVVSHSAELAAGVIALAREMSGPSLSLEAAGGFEEEGALGTDAGRVHEAISRAMSPDGVLVLMDLGSALMSAEFAVEMLGSEGAGPVRLSAAPLVEGTVAAAVAAAGGASLDEVAAEARGALEMKVSQVSENGASDEGAATPACAADAAADARAELAVRNEIGLHARPAARFVETARGFDADVRVARTGAGGAPVSARSLTGLMSLGARLGDTLVVTASGPDASSAVDALQALAADGFGDGVTTGSAAPSAGVVAISTTPRGKSQPPEPGDVLSGVAASAGIAIGPARSLAARAGGDGSPPPDRAAGDAAAERTLLDDALAAARAAIERDRDAMTARAGPAEAEIFDAHLALLDDDALLSPAHQEIAGGVAAETAWHDAAEQVAAVYRGLPEPLLAERATDVLDVGRRVTAEIARSLGDGERAAPGHGDGQRPADDYDDAAAATPSIVIADELTPADAAGLDSDRVLAIATSRGSATAHAAILARALGIPAVVGLGDGLLAIDDGTTLLLDGDAATVTVAPAEELIAHASERRERERAAAAHAAEHAHEPATLTDGTRIEVFANLGSTAETERAVAAGAEGVGLLRTEFLFLDRDELPTEDEQTEQLTEIATGLRGRPLIVRTLDAGADKPLPALPMAPEQNPFLGVRGIRLGLQRPEVLGTQLRAALRVVAAGHPLKLMLPMVATLDEITATRELLATARADTGVDAPFELGIMVEVPAAALTAAQLAPHVDFFSLGTNDLTQYTMAAERGDARLASLLDGTQPAVLRLVDETVRAATAAGRWVGVCGELAGDPAAAVLLAGLGVTELSMSPGLIPGVKQALRSVSMADAREAARAALKADSATAARALAQALL
jgi:phosphocarrier protein FPr